MAPPARSGMAKAKAVLSVAASVATTAVLVRSMARDYLPSELHDYLFSGINNYLSRFTFQVTIIIEEIDGLVVNQIYEAAQTYLSRRIPSSANLLKATLPDKDHHISVSMGRDEEIVDTFAGVKFRWVHRSDPDKSKSRNSCYDATANLIAKGRFFELSFHSKHKDTAINAYLPHIVREGRSLRDQTRTLKIFTYNHQNSYNMKNAWSPVNLDHPATFETLAMDTGLKETIMSDLERFVRRREYYRKVGKAWKRGYLLHGPPGTGKSSLIAAMANFLKFDAYDLDLTDLNRNSDLRRLLVGTANRSILVVEDIDCTVELEDRSNKARAKLPPGFTMEKKVTLSGLLNFTDGLWSSCGDERIIIFTTNHMERLDPALLRPGRMDVHIHMSYCTPCAFRILASNYLGLTQHPLFGQVEDSIAPAKVTPAEVAEQLLKSEDPGDALSDLIGFLEAKAKQNTQDSSAEDKNYQGPNTVEVAVDDDEQDDEFYEF